MRHSTRRIAILPMLLGLVCGASTASPRPQKTEHVFVVGADVDAKGQVTQTQPDADVAKPIAVVLDEALKHWRFVPAQKDGKAVSVHTFIKAKLEALPAANDTYTLRISFLGQGPKWEPSPPRYPEDAIRDRKTGLVAITGLLGPDGKTSITDASGDEPFVKVASTRFLQDTGVPETVDGQPSPARIRTFVTFRLDAVFNGKKSSNNDEPYDLARLTDEEKALWRQLESKKDGNDSSSIPSQISSVLQPSNVEPVILQS